MVTRTLEAEGSDASISHRAQYGSVGGGNEQLYEEQISAILEDYSAYAHNVARRFLRNDHDVQEAVQEAFLSAYRAYPKFNGNSKISTWLYRIVVNACLMRIRQDRARARRIDRISQYRAVGNESAVDPERLAINSELGDKLEAELEQLSPELRAVIVLRDVYGFSGEEASEKLGISVSALKSRLRRGRVVLRERLSEYAPPGLSD